MNILLIEPFYTGSHKYWADSIKKYSTHRCDILTLKGRNWKWRMHGAALELFAQYKELDQDYDLIICSAMMNVATFKALISCRIPLISYFHENQFAYPKSPYDCDQEQGRDDHYGFINYQSALCTDLSLFNSLFNLSTMQEGIKKLLNQMPDYKKLPMLHKVRVLPVGIERPQGEVKKDLSVPRIIWNHRQEYDKNPGLFFQLMEKLSSEKMDFELHITGENFVDLSDQLMKKTTVHGKLPRERYMEVLNNCNMSVVTSIHDFQGLSVLESAASGLQLILPERLAYPEHFEPYSVSYYQKEEDIYKLLKNQLTNYKKPVLKRSYFWDDIIKEFDNIIYKFKT